MRACVRACVIVCINFHPDIFVSCKTPRNTSCTFTYLPSEKNSM